MFFKYIICLLSILKLVTSQRRITNGSSVSETVNTKFMVYLIGATHEYSDPGWMCGGCILHESLILTSAACLEDVERIYVIAGYRQYVNTEDIEKDPCTKRLKKKIISYALSQRYGAIPGKKFNSTHDEKYAWTQFDIGIARVDTPFDFYDSTYDMYCSYRPGLIYANYQLKFETPGTNTVIYGWGHAVYYRPAGDLNDYNEHTLKYTSAKVMDHEECMKSFSSHSAVELSIARGDICVNAEGQLDASGRFTTYELPVLDMCLQNRRSNNNTNDTDVNGAECIEPNTNYTNSNHASDALNISNTRRHGICQNDHGIPLVMWAGGKPYAIGVASAFFINNRMECVGPYLFASIKCMSKFVNCVLSAQSKSTRRNLAYCNAPDEERGFRIKENNVSWPDESQDAGE